MKAMLLRFETLFPIRERNKDGAAVLLGSSGFLNSPAIGEQGELVQVEEKFGWKAGGLHRCRCEFWSPEYIFKAS